MAEACIANPLLARKTHATILQRLSSVGQSAVAVALGVSEATVSRLKSQDLESFSAFLAALNLKIVPAESRCYTPQYMDHLHYFAKIGIDAAKPAELEQDWGEGQ